MIPLRTREIRLASRPRGRLALFNFELAQSALPEVEHGQLLVKNLFMSVDGYMRARMIAHACQVPPFRLGHPLEGSAVGEVVMSRADGFAAGDPVTSMYGWREHFVASAHDVHPIGRDIQPLSLHLGALGAAGLTAWVGLNLGEAAASDRVYISAAAGAVGSVAGQLAKLRGCRVSGSADSREKVAMLRGELGFDAAFNDAEGDTIEQLRVAAPDGVDVYFDNVGGGHLEAVLSVMRTNGRIVACEAMSQGDGPAQGVRNLSLFISKRLSMKGFIVSDSLRLAPLFTTAVGAYVRRGQLRTKETVVVGLERAPQALITLLASGSIGKMIVKL